MALVFLAPIPLGSNRAWAWMLLSFASLLIVALDAIFHDGLRKSLALNKSFVVALFLFALYPLIQLVPLPGSLLPDGQAALVQNFGLLIDQISLSPGMTAEIWMRQGSALLLSLVLLRLFQVERRRYQFAVLLALMGVLEVLIGFGGIFVNAGHAANTSLAVSRISGTYVNPNHFAGFIELSLPFAVALAVHHRKNEFIGGQATIAWSVLAFAMLLGLLASGSRGGVIAMALGGAFATLVHTPDLKDLQRKLLAVLVAVVLLGMLLMITGGIGDAMQALDRKETLTSRLVQWRDTVDAMHGFWPFGIGLGAYDPWFPMVRSRDLGYQHYNYVHNDYLQAVVELGVVGAGLFVGLVFTGLRGSLRRTIRKARIRHHPVRFAALWASSSLLLHGCVDFNFQIPANFLMFFVVMAALVSGGNSVRHAQDSYD